MKKIIIATICLISLNSYAFLGDKVDRLTSTKTIVPCALALMVPIITNDRDHMGMGWSACAAVVGYNLMDNSLSPYEQRDIQKQMREFVSQAKKDLKDNFENNKRNYAYYQEVIRDTVRQELVFFDEKLEKVVDEYMNSEEFRKKLEEQSSRGLTEKEKAKITEDVIQEVINSLARQ